MTNEWSSANNIPKFHPDRLKSKKELINPFDWYKEQRSCGPIHYDEKRGVYDVFSYEGVAQLLKNDQHAIRPTLANHHAELGLDSPLVYLQDSMMWSNGEAHSDIKSELFSYFRPDEMKKIEDLIAQVTDSQIQSVTNGRTEFDFVQEFAAPVTLQISMDLIGIQMSDYERMREWIDEIIEIKRSEYSSSKSKMPDTSTQAVEYMKDIVEVKKEDPKHDLMSMMVQETELTDEEIGSNCLDILMASHSTMADFLSNAIFLIIKNDLTHKTDNGELSGMLEEVLRYRSPLQAHMREMSEAMKIDGTTIPRGEIVILWLGAANRDPERYDQPETFLPDRNPEHLAFGAGAHTCIAAPLARFEAPIILRSFMEHFDDAEILYDSIEPTSGASGLGFKRLPVSAKPAESG